MTPDLPPPPIEYDGGDFWSASINTGWGWHTVYREPVEDALQRLSRDSSTGVASPGKGVPPLDESQLDHLLRLMDSAEDGRPELTDWDRAQPLIDEMRGKG